MAAKHWHLITYDVRCPKRLKKVARKLEAYGNRVQYSVVYCSYAICVSAQTSLLAKVT